jgi:hypothetical protein
LVNAFLWEHNAEAFGWEIGSLDRDDEADTAQRLKLWHKTDPLLHLDNRCGWILRSPQCRDCFIDKIKQIQPETTVTVPLVGSITCWHGDVDALE